VAAGGVVFINRAAGNKLYLSLVHNVFNVTGEPFSGSACLAVRPLSRYTLSCPAAFPCAFPRS
jgi:hypothetical protein